MNAVKVEVAEVKLDERKGIIRNGDRKGEEYHIRQQEVWLHNGSLYPVRVMIPLELEQPPYQPGAYTFAPESFQAGDYDRLEFARNPKLQPLLESARSSAPSAKAG